MSSNQHIVDITIIWPDDKWDQQAEQNYLNACLQDVVEHLQAHPIQNREELRVMSNNFGRTFATIHINPCKGE